MIDKEVAIVPDMVVRHDEGLTYRVEDVRASTIGYEQTHKIGANVVNYVQLEAGGFRPGTKWSKDEEGFRQHFTIVDSDETQAFAPAS